MVRVPGPLEDAGYHRESQEDEGVKFTLEPKTDEPLEDRPPVTLEYKNKESKDRPDLGRGPVNMFKVENIEEKHLRTTDGVGSTAEDAIWKAMVPDTKDP
uniref:Uncharacterized protein n=1 Tax=Peronospora matthiolae TaxID=2874970 RepID=A0AAV1UC78_9STRA